MFTFKLSCRAMEKSSGIIRLSFLPAYQVKNIFQKYKTGFALLLSGDRLRKRSKYKIHQDLPSSPAFANNTGSASQRNQKR